MQQSTSDIEYKPKPKNKMRDLEREADNIKSLLRNPYAAPEILICEMRNLSRNLTKQIREIESKLPKENLSQTSTCQEDDFQKLEKQEGYIRKRMLTPYVDAKYIEEELHFFRDNLIQQLKFVNKKLEKIQ